MICFSSLNVTIYSFIVSLRVICVRTSDSEANLSMLKKKWTDIHASVPCINKWSNRKSKHSISLERTYLSSFSFVSLNEAIEIDLFWFLFVLANNCFYLFPSAFRSISINFILRSLFRSVERIKHLYLHSFIQFHFPFMGWTYVKNQFHIISFRWPFYNLFSSLYLFFVS